MTGKTQPSAELFDVTFTKAHRHGGKDYKIGDTAQVTAKAREKLRKRDVIKG